MTGRRHFEGEIEMKAVQYVQAGEEPEVRIVEDPTPGPGQVLLKIKAAGLCHSDIAVMDAPEQFPFELPMTLGHECVGEVVDAGVGARPLVTMGEQVLVYGPWGCGRCRQCAAGYENYCYNAKKLGIVPPGLGRDGGAAEYMLVDRARYLVPIGDLDPVKAAPLTDAALTPYHAVLHSLPKLKANSNAVVFGVGGLGHIGIQLLRHLTPANVIALDVSEDRLEMARKVGAQHALASNEEAVEQVMDLTHGLGADVVFDFVGAQPTIDLGRKMTKVRGDWNIVGIGGGVAPVGFGVIPYECQVLSPYWGTRADLYDVVALAQEGILDIHTETYSLDEGPEAYRKLRNGEVKGRAVLVP